MENYYHYQLQLKIALPKNLITEYFSRAIQKIRFFFLHQAAKRSDV